MHRLLIVDDSPYYRLRFSKIFSQSANFEVAGVAEDGDVAIRRMIELLPDVVLLDLLMPNLDGFAVLRWAMKNRPTPIVVCSSFTDRHRVFKALELGAVDFLLKPAPRAGIGSSALEARIIQRIEVAAAARTSAFVPITPDVRAAVLPAERKAEGANVEVICLAASTGGPAAIQKLLSSLPSRLRVPMVLVQHMPLGFTGPFAERLDSFSHYTVCEGRDDEPLRERHFYIAPAGSQTTVHRQQGRLRLRVTRRSSSDVHAPSADWLFSSASAACGPRTLGVVLTGMGDDGTKGAEAIISGGGHVVAESGESAIVFGMPKSVIDRDLASAILPLEVIPQILPFYATGDEPMSGEATDCG